MSTRRRIAWTSATVLAVLALGSILSACLLGTSAIGPKKAFAGASAPNVGVLGVGERTSGPVLESVSATTKIAGDQSVGATSTAPLSAPAVKLIVTVARAKKVAHPTAATIGLPITGKSVRSSARWNRAKVSWYGPGFYGNTMAGGGKLRRNSLVVAHKRLPFGTKVQFSLHGRSVVAVVQDRGPYVRGRVFDLGPGTAKALGFSGVGMVKYRIISRGHGRSKHRR